MLIRDSIVSNFLAQTKQMQLQNGQSVHGEKSF